MALVRRLTIAAAAFGLFMNGEVMAFDIEAHRGGRALFPENTLPSFANALSMGVDTLELDIGVTKDGAISAVLGCCWCASRVMSRFCPAMPSTIFSATVAGEPTTQLCRAQ
jgi:hypothetical protein